jgi:transcription initiation factor TFIIB
MQGETYATDLGQKCVKVVKSRDGKVLCSCGANVYSADGGTYCGRTGVELGREMVSSQPRAYTLEEEAKKFHHGIIDPFAHGDGIGSTFTFYGKDYSGKQLKNSYQLYKMHIQHMHARVHDSKDRNMAYAMELLKTYKNNLSLPDPVALTARRIYEVALNKKLVRGRSIGKIVAASIEAACRQTETPRRLEEIAEKTGIAKKDVARCYRLLLKEIPEVAAPKKNLNSTNFVSKVAETAHISQKSQGVAHQLINFAKENGINVSKDPISIVSAALYIACKQTGEEKPQREISKAAGITDVTIRNRCNDFKDKGIRY